MGSLSTQTVVSGAYSQLINPYYVSGDATKGLIHTVDQATFANKCAFEISHSRG